MTDPIDPHPARGKEHDRRHFSRRKLVGGSAALALGTSLSALGTTTPAQAQTQAQTRWDSTPEGTGKTLIIASHPYPERSVVNRALWEPAQNAEGALFKNLETVYGDDLRGFDAAGERRLYAEMDRLVLMFPIHWFNMTPMMKAYMNEIWGQGAPSELRGKEMLVVTTTAGGPEAYTSQGRLGFTIEEILTPLRASANYTGMVFSEPLAFLGAAGAGADARRTYQDRLAARLREAPRRA